jgi:predicted hotdog family 3-hydroxylacyl-ACP dehydratase
MLKPSAPDHAWIARHIPHQGSMCLLDGVEAWNAQHIQCRAGTHRAPGNPLRACGRLGAACGIEYAAQAMAVHGALLTPSGTTAARASYLVSVRDTRLLVPRLDDIAADLEVGATCIVRSGNAIFYRFNVTAAGILLLNGRATIMIDTDTIRPITGAAP